MTQAVESSDDIEADMYWCNDLTYCIIGGRTSELPSQ